MKEFAISPTPEHYKRFQNETYGDYAQAIYKDITYPYRTPHVFLSGDRYRIATAKGEPLRIESIYRHKQTVTGINPQYDYVCLFAFNNTGELVGHRRSYVHEDNGSYDVMMGGIATKDRGRGYAMPLELVHQQVLQQRASIIGRRIVYVVENDNKKDLDSHLKKQKHPDTATQPLISLLKDEQKRWQTMYSEDGKLGINQYGSKHIHPDLHPFYQEYFAQRDIVLVREDIQQEGRILSTTRIEKTSPITDKNSDERITEIMLALQAA